MIAKNVFPNLQRQNIHSRGLRLCLLMNEGSGNKINNVVNPTTTTALTGGTWARGNCGHTISFDGTNDYIPANYKLPQTTCFSIVVRAYVKSSTDYFLFITQRAATGGYFQYYCDISATPVFKFWNGSTAISDTKTLTVGKWYWGAVTHTGSTLKFYVNGKNTSTQSLSTGTFVDHIVTIQLDRDYGTTHAYADGNLSEVRVYERCLSDNEVKQIHAGLA